jgi:hypothetical protein
MNFLFVNIPRENAEEKKFFEGLYNFLLENNHSISLCTDLYDPHELDKRIKKYFIPRKNLHQISKMHLINRRFYLNTFTNRKLRKFNKFLNKVNETASFFVNFLVFRNKKYEWISNYDETSQLEFEKLTRSLISKNSIYGFRKLQKIINDIIIKNCIDCVIVFNSVDHLQFLGKLISDFYNLNFINYERSDYVGKFYKESHSFHYKSDLMSLEENSDEFKIEEYLNHFEESQNSVLKNLYGYRNNQDLRNINVVKPKNKKIVFIPMDNIAFTGWAHKNTASIKDYAGLPSPKETLKLIDKSIDYEKYEVYLKPHPGCLIVDKNFIPNNFIFYDGKIENIIYNTDVLIGFKSKLNLVFYYANVPIIQLLKSPFTKFEIFKYSSINNLQKNLNDIKFTQSAQHKKFLSYFYKIYCVNEQDNISFFKNNIIRD